jgi:Ca2+-transporting ATPase
LLAVSLAVAVIPEGLPAMTTILMAMGVKKMAQLNALVKDLPSVETLGSCTCICSDKTGTLTLNKMTVKKVLLVSDIINKHDVELEQITDNYAKYDEIIRSGVLCNTAELNENNGTIGDPTEGALLMLSNDFNMPYAQTKANYKTLFELPFDSDRKRMSTINIVDNKEVLYVKGATDEILDVCESYLDENNNIQKMTTEIKNLIKAKNTELSANALRILSFAKREVDGVEKDSNLENKLIYMGLMGMIDPPRKEVKSAVEKCHAAGIKVIMITGDHAITAKAIATELDIFREGNEIINGDELERMSEQDLIKRIENTTVFSRVSPSGKMRIIKALQANDEITSMTGDGVNDAPSLKAADIGVAMGITGTDVAKSSANVILLDDNFTTIENAVFQGRRIFRNIQKVVQFLVSGSIAEVLIILFTTLLACIPGVS